ncbi:MAG: ATP-grasp domain-containing protein, partial [Bacteroidetes bacterium]
QKILIANRGEIALRILRTCRRIGIGAVAVYSDADHEALYVREAGEAVYIGPAAARESYLNTARLLAAAKASGCDAIHPGYGFLSENAVFAEQCAEAGLTFIGPPAAAIAAMGSKIRAKQIAAEQGVPVIPGYQGADQSDARLREEALRVGFPLLVKASAGGGGKGMRIVREASELERALEGARSEAMAAFGDASLLIERYFDTARHIEIQVFGDQQGNLIHLGERECSVQRRYQKVIEESPSPAISPELRAEMGAAAVAVVRAIGYYSAGTVEFILTPEGFFFLEVNTRLQVEHPVTESVLGLDLVQWQIEVAEGRSLPLTQAQVAASGHAIECRIYSEDPDNQFFPDSGKVLLWKPGPSPGIRYDSGVETGSEVSIHYDPMIAKVIAHAPDRIQAIRKLRRALEELALLGLKSNQDFLLRLLDHPDFQAGTFDTHFIRQHEQELKSPAVDPLPFAIAATLIRWSQRQAERTHFRGLVSGWRNSLYQYAREEFGWKEGVCRVEYREVSPFDTLAAQATQGDSKTAAESQNQPVTLSSLPLPEGVSKGDSKFFHIKSEGKEFQVELHTVSYDTISLTINGYRQVFSWAEAGASLWLHSPGKGTLRIEVLPRFPEKHHAESPGACKAPMPGKVLRILVKAGDAVAAGDPLLVLSSMKMETTLYASTAGVVEEVLTETDAFVEGGAVLVRVEERE